MAIAGPRLDRPSGVGDEGRPRATSVTLAALVVVGLSGLTLWQIGALSALTTLGLACVLLVGGLALLTRDTLGELAVGHLLYHAGAVSLLLFLFVTPLLRHSLVFLGLFLGLFGVAATWANVLVPAELETASKRAPLSYGALLGWLAVGIVVLGFGVALFGNAGRLLGDLGTFAGLSWFLAAVFAAGLCGRLALGVLPIAELSPVDRRPARERLVARLKRVATVVALVGLGALLAMGLLGTRRILTFAVRNPWFESLLSVVSGPFVLWPILLVSTLSGLAALAGYLVRHGAMQVEAGNYELVAGVLSGGLMAALLLAVLITPLFAFISLAPYVVALSLIASPLAFVLGLVAVAAMETGALPGRGAGPAIGAAGLIVAAIGAGLGTVPVVLVFALVAGGVLVWDLCTFGLGLTVELGHRPETRRLELYHGLLSLGVGALAVVGVTGLELVRRSLAADVGAWPAVGVAVAGAILLALASRERRA